jgi:hypothetical protein
MQLKMLWLKKRIFYYCSILMANDLYLLLIIDHLPLTYNYLLFIITY